MARHRTYASGNQLYAGFGDALNEFLSMLANLRVVKQTSTTVRVVAATNDDQAIVGIDGAWRFSTANVDATHPGGAAGIYDIWVTSAVVNLGNEDAGTETYGFAVKITASGGTPTGSGAEALYRKIGECGWDGTAITYVVNTLALPGHARGHSQGGKDPLYQEDAIALSVSGSPTTAFYYKDALGVVHFDATLIDLNSGGATLGTVLATLPVGYRPLRTLTFPVWRGTTSNGDANWATVNTSGQITTFNNWTNGYYVFNAIRFRTDPLG